MIVRKYVFHICGVCKEQASSSYTGDPHLVCEHQSANGGVEPLAEIEIVIGFKEDGVVVLEPNGG